MIRIAMKMLLGDRARYLGILVGLTFASLLITQQSGIFVGLMMRTYSFVDDTPQADIWVVDPNLEHHADSKRMLDNELFRVRGVEGVAWAMPMFKSFTQVRMPSGQVRGAIVVGVDDTTLMGLPGEIVQGAAADVRKADAVLVDEAELAGKLAYEQDGEARKLRVGDTVELNDHRAVIAGTFRIKPAFFWEPTIYTTISRARSYAPMERRQLSYVMVKAAPGVSVAQLCERIEAATGQRALTAGAFRWQTASYILEKTGIAINFGMAVGLGFVVGTAVAGQTFYNFTIDNLRHFAALKALGTSNITLLGMIVCQSLTVGLIGYGLGVGAAAASGVLLGSTSLAFALPWQLLALSGAAILSICLLAAVLSVRKVLTLEPGIVFKG